jgi:hypothetical protein
MSTQPTCPNCGRVITCGCQRRVATNGASVCTACIQTYDHQLAQKAQATINSNNTTTTAK